MQTVTSETPKEKQNEFSPLQWQTTVAKKITKVENSGENRDNQNRHIQRPKIHEVRHQAPSKDIYRAIRSRTLTQILTSLSSSTGAKTCTEGPDADTKQSSDPSVSIIPLDDKEKDIKTHIHRHMCAMFGRYFDKLDFF